MEMSERSRATGFAAQSLHLLRLVLFQASKRAFLTVFNPKAPIPNLG